MFEGISRLLEREPESKSSTPPKIETPKSPEEIRRENLDRSIRLKTNQLKSLEEELRRIDIPYFADPHHPGVRGDKVLQAGLDKEIERLKVEIAALEEVSTN